MIKDQKIRYIGPGGLYGKVGTFDRYTNASKTRCRFFIEHENGAQSGYTGLLENIEAVKVEVSK